MASGARDDDWQDDADDRRRSPRRPIAADACLEHSDGELHGTVVNISFGGALFVTRTLSPVVPVGGRIRLTVEGDKELGFSQVAWRGAVVRSQRSADDGPDRVAYAIAFDEGESLPSI